MAPQTPATREVAGHWEFASSYSWAEPAARNESGGREAGEQERLIVVLRAGQQLALGVATHWLWMRPRGPYVSVSMGTLRSMIQRAIVSPRVLACHIVRRARLTPRADTIRESVSILAASGSPDEAPNARLSDDLAVLGNYRAPQQSHHRPTGHPHAVVGRPASFRMDVLITQGVRG